jgi:hypothetical protein
VDPEKLGEFTSGKNYFWKGIGMVCPLFLDRVGHFGGVTESRLTRQSGFLWSFSHFYGQTKNNYSDPILYAV